MNLYPDCGGTLSVVTNLSSFWDRSCTVVAKFDRLEATGPSIIMCPLSEPECPEHADNVKALKTQATKRIEVFVFGSPEGVSFKELPRKRWSRLSGPT